MKPFAIAATALFALAQPAFAQAPGAAPSEALIDRFMAALPDRGDAFSVHNQEIDPAELSRLAALNPGKEAKVRSILQSNLACTAPEIEAGTLRMLRTVARNLGAARLEKLVGFYSGPDYAAFAALAVRMQGKAKPSAEDSAAMARLMGTYPLQAFHQQLDRAGEIIGADPGFMTGAMKCAAEQVDAMTAAGLKVD